MSRLATRFVAGLGRECAAPTERQLDALLQRARTAHPKIGVDVGLYMEYLGSALREAQTPVDAAESLPVEDLYLALGCQLGDTEALRVFEERFAELFQLTHATWRGGAVDRDDFVQAVYERLLVGQPPRISTYRGKGPLRAWVKMVAIRQLVDLARARRRDPTASEDDAIALLMMPSAEPTKQLATRRYRPEVQAAIEDTLLSLSQTQRLLLRQRFVHGLTLAELARLHGVHRVTVSKRLAKARRAILEGIGSTLAERLKLETLDANSIARTCVSQLDLSLDRLLASRCDVDESG